MLKLLANNENIVGDDHVDFEQPIQPLKRPARIPVPKICSCCSLAVAKCELSDYDDGINVCEALGGPHHDSWLTAMDEEIKSLKSQNVWNIVEKTKDKHFIDCKLVKSKVDGTLNKFKARLVARGFSQIAGVHYAETYSPVVK